MELKLIKFCAMAILVSRSLQYVSIPFNTKQYYGPDGPWQAVEIEYYYTQLAQKRSVSLLPCVFVVSDVISGWIPAPDSCDNRTEEACGSGGLAEPPPSTAVFANSAYENWWTLGRAGWGSRGDGVGASVTWALSPGHEMVDASVAIGNFTYYYPSGVQTGAVLGLFNLGGNWLPSVSSSLFSYQNGWSESNSFTLQLGSVAFGYSGSLVLGGYDRGRVIGPVIQYPASSNGVELRVIVIGMLGDDRPFPFAHKSGLLRSGNPPVAQFSAAEAQPQVPYIALPTATVDKIAALLPVTFNETAGFYLWNTDDPAYGQIVSSSAYLGFVFPTTAGSNTTIKVPFALLNLTLEASISKLESDVPYLPIVKGLDPNKVSIEVVLGRAFLQAAFIGTNWANNVSWIAQAPGPGVNGSGFGQNQRDILFDQATLNVESDDSLFIQSWAGHLKSLEPPSNDPKPKTHEATGGGDDLSSGAIAGIVVGSVAFLSATLFILWVRRRRKATVEPAEIDSQGQQPEMEASVLRRELHTKANMQELPVQEKSTELSGDSNVHELHGSDRE